MADAARLLNPIGNAVKNSFGAAVGTGGNGPEDYVPHLPEYVGRANGVDMTPQAQGQQMNSRTLGKTGYTRQRNRPRLLAARRRFRSGLRRDGADILQTARSLDVNFWDTADVYGGGQSERRIGAFKDKKGVLVATKLGRGVQFEGMTRYTRPRSRTASPARSSGSASRCSTSPSSTASPSTCCAMARSSPGSTTCATPA